MTVAPRSAPPVSLAPTLSPEHGVYIVLVSAWILGASAAQSWTLNTTLAAAASFLAFQAEHPLSQQLKQRRSWKPRFLLWAGLYGAGALGLGLYLLWQTPVLIWLYGAALGVLGLNLGAVWLRRQRSSWNEMLTFSAVGLATPLVYGATTGELGSAVFSLWGLNALFFSGAVFRLKLRKPKARARLWGSLYQLGALGMIGGLCYWGVLSLTLVVAYGLSPLSWLTVNALGERYRTCPIGVVALTETLLAVGFTALAALTLLPPRL